MELRKLAETATSITLGWDPVPGAEGYLFYKDGQRVSRTFDPARRSIRFSKPGVYRVQAVIFNVIDQDTYPDPVTPPPVTKRYAPRTHNLGGRDQDPRFCCKPEYGVVDKGSYYMDEMGCTYTKEPYGTNPDGMRDRSRMVPGLKGADSMDGLEPCDSYVGPDGNTHPPYPPDSYLR